MGLCMPTTHTSRGRALGTEGQGTCVALLSRTDLQGWVFGRVVGWAAGLAGGRRAWPLHPAVFLARTPGPGALRRLEGMRAGPFLWNKTLSTSSGSERLLSPGLWGAGKVAPFQVRKPSLREGGYWGVSVPAECQAPSVHPGLSPSNGSCRLPALQREANVH